MCRNIGWKDTKYRYKCKFVCLDCRYSKKAWHEDYQVCHCGNVMFDIGMDYRVPRKTNGAGWKELETRVLNNEKWHKCGC